ncbi:hypothetical protein [Streptosporangium sp. NPDC052375]
MHLRVLERDHMTDEAECIICGAPAEPGVDYCGEICRIADATGEQPPDWD